MASSESATQYFCAAVAEYVELFECLFDKSLKALNAYGDETRKDIEGSEGDHNQGIAEVSRGTRACDE